MWICPVLRGHCTEREVAAGVGLEVHDGLGRHALLRVDDRLPHQVLDRERVALRWTARWVMRTGGRTARR